MKLTYNVSDKPAFGKVLVFAFQQLLAILAATIAVPAIIGNGMSQASALFGAGVGTLVYLFFTKSKSPVFLGSSFAFLGSMGAAFAGGVSASLGFLGLLLGALFAGLVYVVIALVVRACGSAWVDKLMPAVVIGPTVAIIGLSLAGNAVGDLTKGNVTHKVSEIVAELDAAGNPIAKTIENDVQNASTYLCLLCGLVTLFVTIICSVYGKKMAKMIPFIIGIAAGYALAAVFTAIGLKTDKEELQIVNFALFESMDWNPISTIKGFSFYKAFFGDAYAYGNVETMGSYIIKIAVAYVPVAFVVFAEHIADHKNLSSIIESDLLKDPGLDRTLLGDGVGSVVGAFFGGCPNTTYGESVGCVAISGNASSVTIFVTAILAIIASFIAPFVTLLATIPSCVMGGVCFALYGFIAVSGLKMLQKVDLDNNRNLFVVSVILIAGVGGMLIKVKAVEITEVACALILGILVKLVVKPENCDKNE